VQDFSFGANLIWRSSYVCSCVTTQDLRPGDYNKTLLLCYRICGGCWRSVRTAMYRSSRSCPEFILTTETPFRCVLFRKMVRRTAVKFYHALWTYVANIRCILLDDSTDNCPRKWKNVKSNGHKMRQFCIASADAIRISGIAELTPLRCVQTMKKCEN